MATSLTGARSPALVKGLRIFLISRAGISGVVHLSPGSLIHSFEIGIGLYALHSPSVILKLVF